jgi:eukaryotic-like serine/threonine-protein kinase
VSDLSIRLGRALAGRYSIQRQLGAGGMGAVFLAEDLKHHRQVAIKVLNPELSAVIGGERFLREIEVAAGLSHPLILPLHDSGSAEGLLYYVMPYVEGESLRQRLAREKQLPIADSLRIAREVADALEHVHRQGVVHRDIKPENILLQGGHAVVADFGIASAVSAAGGERLTATGLAIGTPAYMSPEQAAGGTIDARSDLYSLGCVLYEMLAGQPPFTAATVESMAHQHRSVPPRPATHLRPTVPHGIDRALGRALAKAAADRFPSAQEMAVALAAPDPAADARTEEIPRPPRRAWRLAWMGGAALATVAIVWLVWLVWPFIPWPRPPAPSPVRRAVAVLPLQNLSAESAHAYFAGGMHDELLTQLAKVASLEVISRTSVMGYQGTSKPLRHIAKELNVGSIVEGTVQVVGTRLRVNVQLIDAATDKHLWAESYDRTLDDAFAIQGEIAQRVATAVGAALSAAEKGRLAAAPTVNAEAYRLYLQGREYYLRPGVLRQDREIAQQLYERALALDPDFALGHAALSLVHGQMYFLRYDPSEARAAAQLGEAEAALRLAPELPEGHAAMGRVHYTGRRDFRRALGEFMIAVRGLPNDAEIWGWIAATHRRLGQWTEVLAASEKGEQLDPRNAHLLLTSAPTFVLLRRYADAVRKYERALSLAPDLHAAAVQRAWTYLKWQGQLDSVRTVLNRLPIETGLTFSGDVAAERAKLLLWERDPDSLQRLLRLVRRDVFDAQEHFLPLSLYRAWAHRMRGESAEARAEFESARLRLDAAVRDLPQDRRVHLARGLAFAGLGRREAALQEARWFQGSRTYSGDAFDGPAFAEGRAQILAQLGEAEAAVEEIERLLARPGWLSVHELRLDPAWDPIRDHPRWKAMLLRYGNRAT